MPALSSPPWCIPHHHPGSQHPSSGSSQRTDPLCLCALPASPTEGRGESGWMGNTSKAHSSIFRNLYGVEPSSGLSHHLGGKKGAEKKINKKGKGGEGTWEGEEEL